MSRQQAIARAKRLTERDGGTILVVDEDVYGDGRRLHLIAEHEFGVFCEDDRSVIAEVRAGELVP